jgi:hypothetical protein
MNHRAALTFIGNVILTFLLLTCIVFQSKAQQISNLRVIYASPLQDTVRVDSLSLVPGSGALWSDTLLVDTSAYRVDAAAGLLIWNKSATTYKNLGNDSLRFVYRVFPFSFSHSFHHKDRSRIETQYKGLYNPFEYNEKSDDFDIFKLQGLNHTGSISRGVSFGNAQDVVVNSSLNLQLSGKLNENIEILASVTDNNVPIQPEGNTQQIQDFDKVFIQLSNQNSRLIAGDFELSRPESYFMNFYKKAQGGILSTRLNLTPANDSAHYHMMNATVSASISKGKYSRQVIQGIEANQGPYRLTGADNELFIVILSGSEKVYVDGVHMTRGQEYDYVIDYNTAQLTFTAKRLITKDSRITVEFQYSDKNYSRSLIFFNDTYEQKNLKLKLNVYSEQDAKNQPLLQSIDEAQKILLAGIGDSIQNAIYPNVDSVAYSNSELLYEKRDTVIGAITYSIYVYSTDSLNAFFRVGFSFTGTNSGNYVAINNERGRVYAWVAPVNGVPQGAYEPVTLIITPKKQQMLTLGADYLLGKNTAISGEGAVSNNDVNLYSDKNKGDDAGFAGSISIRHLQPLKKDWNLIASLQAEHEDKEFKPIEAFRNVEFTRDWNLGTVPIYEDENGGSFSIGVTRQNIDFINYQFRTFQKGAVYKGYMHMLNFGSRYKGFALLGDASYLTTSGTLVRSNYLRQKADLSKLIKKWVVGVNEQVENNSILDPLRDTLLYTSFSYRQWQAYFALADSSSKRFRTDFTQRYDYTPRNNEYKLATVADNASVSLELQPNPASRFETGAIYRRLRINDSTITFLQEENSLLSHLQLDLTILKGAFVLNTYYEVGTGQELKKEYTFIEVPPGEGAYIWNDYDSNNIKTLNEFELAAFAAEANYIKLYTPTNEYIRTHSNQVSQVLNINPSALIRKESPFGFLNVFNDQLAFKIDNKTTGEKLDAQLNPFSSTVNDSSLVSTNSTFRNTIFFNRSSAVFGMDFTYQGLRNKSLLTNGFESRIQRSINGNVRWNISRLFGTSVFGENGYKQNLSDFFSARDYYIRYGSVEPKFTIQPGNNFRATISYEYTIKRNALGDTNELSTQDNFGLELKYSSIKRGAITGKINYINIAYNGLENTSIAYEMLEGLKTGKNMTWSISAQQNLTGSLQLNINYEGRKSPDVKAVHTGGVQLTAYF